MELRGVKHSEEGLARALAVIIMIIVNGICACLLQTRFSTRGDFWLSQLEVEDVTCI